MKRVIFVLLILLIIGHLILFRLISWSKLQGDVMGILYPCTGELRDGYLSHEVLDTSNLKYAYFFLLESTEEHSGLSCIQYVLDFNSSSNIEGLYFKVIDSALYIDNKVFPKDTVVERTNNYWKFRQFWWKYKKDITLENHGYLKGFTDKFNNKEDFKHPIIYVTGNIDIARTLNVTLIYTFKITFIICCILVLYLLLSFAKSKFRKTKN